MKQPLPPFLKPFLWSYDFDALDKEQDKKRIITNILNVGTKKATDWLLSAYSKEEIAEAIEKPFPGEWDKKSLHFWSLMLQATPGKMTREFL